MRLSVSFIHFIYILKMQPKIGFTSARFLDSARRTLRLVSQPIDSAKENGPSSGKGDHILNYSKFYLYFRRQKRWALSRACCRTVKKN